MAVMRVDAVGFAPVAAGDGGVVADALEPEVEAGEERCGFACIDVGENQDGRRSIGCRRVLQRLVIPAEAGIQ